MGVSGSGKSSVGEALANQYNVAFFDADDFHSAANIEKMKAGIPLTDDDRARWLERLSRLLADQTDVVLACSALKRRYREQLAGSDDAAPLYLYLSGSYALIRHRLQERKGHYFSGDDMLRSQFNDLEEPSLSVSAHIDIAEPFDRVVQNCIEQIERHRNDDTQD